VRGVSADYRLDIESTDGSDVPVAVACFAAVDDDAALAGAVVILRNRHAGPRRGHGLLWVHVGCGRSKYVGQVGVCTVDGREVGR
jgi:hypothetical protein